MKEEQSLLDALANRLGCAYLSDLRFLAGRERSRLGRILREIPLEAASLAEWNDALEYLTGRGPEKSREAARERLLEQLLGT